jgi:hypothetical protein
MADGAQRQLQQSDHPPRVAVTTDIRSADAAFSVAETQRLQAQAQARINATRGPNHIGAAP